MTFGFSTAIDMVSWMVTMLLGAKLMATLVLLNVDRELWFANTRNLSIWWLTKISPLIAMPGLIALGRLQNDTHLTWAGTAFTIFVFIAVPIKIRATFSDRVREPSSR